jgi:uncharacterized repeat protein (TIGR03803 family)
VKIKMHSAESIRPNPSSRKPWNRKFRKFRKLWISCALGLALFLVPLLALHPAAQAQTYSETVIYSFNGGAGGTEPLFSGVVRDEAGNFYGTTSSGGAFNFGTVFKVDPSGNETVLHSFGEGFDGRTPYGALVMDESGNLYGTTVNGGNRNAECHTGCGIVFEIDVAGNMKTLHRFSGPDGASPIGGLIRDTAGNLYGTAETGGRYHSGTIFKLDPTGAESVLYSFAGPPDGDYPEAGLILDAVGNLYGTTAGGGTIGAGTVFELNASGHEIVLHSFGGTSDGSDPMAPLFRASNGDLYGTTFSGGASIGTIFKVDASGNEKVLHTFDGSSGAYPEGALVSDSQGNLYGTTIQGGPGGIAGGILYEITLQGVFSPVYAFPGEPSGGGSPAGPLLMDSAGNFYGTTASGGTTGNGTVYKLTR